MTQRVIDVDGVPTLFSPVLAHTLEPGDLITLEDSRRVPTRIEVIDRIGTGPWARVYAKLSGTRTTLGFNINGTVLRAVGAYAARGGAR